jgi:hypothetical protein
VERAAAADYWTPHGHTQRPRPGRQVIFSQSHISLALLVYFALDQQCDIIENRRVIFVAHCNGPTAAPEKNEERLAGQGAGDLAQCHLLCLRSAILHKLWGGQSCPQPPFRRLFGPSASVRVPKEPAESRLQPGLAAPKFMQTVCSRQSKWNWDLARGRLLGGSFEPHASLPTRRGAG